MTSHTSAGCLVIATAIASRRHLPSHRISLQLSFWVDVLSREDVHRDISIGYVPEETCLKLFVLEGKGCHVCVPPGWVLLTFFRSRMHRFQVVGWVSLEVRVTNTYEEIPSRSQPCKAAVSACPWAGPSLAYRQWNLEKWMDCIAWMRPHFVILPS